MNSCDIRCMVIEEELRTVWPDWHVAKRIAGGSFGDVFQIYRDNYGIRVDSALKVIQVERGTRRDPTLRAFPLSEQFNQAYKDNGYSDFPDVFRSEIQIMEALRGAPNIVTIEDFHLKSDSSFHTLFVRMELLTSLQDLLAGSRENSALSSIEEICKFGRDICTALMYCEKKNIIHRDIKPANLFVDKFGDYKVGDFGASKCMDAMHAAQTMTSIGTISYMAPEVFQGHFYNNTVDIYALGLVLYQLLNNGRMPFVASTEDGGIQDIDGANYKRLRGASIPSLTGNTIGGIQIDASLDEAIRKACAANPSERYQTAEEFYKALCFSEIDGDKESAESDHRQQVQSPSVIVGGKMILPPRWKKVHDVCAVILMQKKKLTESGTQAPVITQPKDYLQELKKKIRWASTSKHVRIFVLSFYIILAVLAVSHVKRNASLFSFIPILGQSDSAPRELSDSWEEIIAAGKDETYLEKYKIGDTKELDLGKEGVIEMELVAFDADELADGSGKAHMTWIAKNLLASSYFMNQEVTQDGGWTESDMRAWIRDNILWLFPKTVRINIKEVKKYSYFDGGTISSVETIWIPSQREIFGTSNSLEDDGPVYNTAYSEKASRKKQNLNSSEPSWWWLRSASHNSGNYFSCVTYAGSVWDGIVEDDINGVAIGFCF